MKRTIAALTCVLIAASAAAAEEDFPISAGTRVRLTTSGAGSFAGTFQGTIARLDANDLTVVDADRGAIMTLPANSITRVQVFAGIRRKTGKGALIGLMTGAALGGFAYGYDTGSGCALDQTYYEPCSGSTAVRGALVTGAMGAGIGALIGYFRHSEQWKDVGVDRVRVQAGPVARGGQVAVSVRLGR